jgi:signal recognition particle receptor subunit beta
MRELPHVFQLNKRDLPGISSVEELRRQLAPGDAPVIEAVASRGVGVHETLKAISRLVLARQTVRRVASG